MFWYTIHAALLILAAYVIGCILGCIVKYYLAARKHGAGGAGMAAGGTASSASPVEKAARAAETRPAAGEARVTGAPGAPAGATAPASMPERGAGAEAEAKAGKAGTAERGTETEAEAKAGKAGAAERGAEAGGAAGEDDKAARLAAAPENATSEEQADAVGKRPAGLDRPRAGGGDDLKRIRGIGKVNERKLNELGIYHFDQIAVWTEEEVRWVGAYLAFAGRIEREDWIGQAKVLAGGGVTDFARRVDDGEVPSSQD